MSRTLNSHGLTMVLAAASAVVAVPALAGGSHTTRIETRPVYGATVTIEQGVRVFRPLPPTQHVVVNPGGVTPLYLNQTDVNVTDGARRGYYSYPGQ